LSLKIKSNPSVGAYIIGIPLVRPIVDLLRASCLILFELIYTHDYSVSSTFCYSGVEEKRVQNRAFYIFPQRKGERKKGKREITEEEDNRKEKDNSK
jgi:hypothetical protein